MIASNNVPVVETNVTPQGFPRRPEADADTLALGSRTIEGEYVEPRVPFGLPLTRFALAGIEVRAVGPSGLTTRGRRSARSAADIHGRLRSPRAAEWLPTLPGA